jgi:hypothetical protein
MVVAHCYPSKDASFRNGRSNSTTTSRSSKSGLHFNRSPKNGRSTNSHVVGRVVTGEITFTGNYTLIPDPDQSVPSSGTSIDSHQ